jgi:hypothetical protein
MPKRTLKPQGKQKGKTGRKTRNGTEHLYRLQKVARMLLQKVPKCKIAEALGVSKSQITHDSRKLTQMWRESADQDTDALKAELLAGLEHVERAAWESYEKSKLNAEESSVTEREVASKGKAVKGSPRKKKKTETTFRTKGQYGDPRFLEVATKCLHKRCEILGLDAPKKVEVDDLSEHDGIRERFARKLTGIAAARKAGAGS